MPYYLENSPQWDETTAGHWAAMFGLLNIVSRPSGGIVADLIYRRFSSDSQLRAIRFKKYWMLSLTVVQGAFAMALGLSRPSSMSAIIGCMAGLGVSAVISCAFISEANCCRLEPVFHASSEWCCL